MYTRVRNFSMIKGDTLSFGLRFPGITHPITNVYFSCSKEPGSTTYVFNKSLNNGITLSTDPNYPNVYIFTVNAQETKNIEVGEYHYDIQLKDSTDTITVITGTIKMRPWITSI